MPGSIILINLYAPHQGREQGAYDAGMTARLWQVSADLVGLTP